MLGFLAAGAAAEPSALRLAAEAAGLASAFEAVEGGAMVDVFVGEEKRGADAKDTIGSLNDNPVDANCLVCASCCQM